MVHGEVLVRGDGLRKVFGHGDGQVVALAETDIDVRRGELLVVRGPSGCGKSTLLQCLSGILRPDAGTVTYDGVVLSALDDDGRSSLRRQRMGFVFQTLNLLPALTVTENVQLPLVLRGLDAPAVRSRAAGALSAVGMDGRATAFPADLSGGEQQRVALARALVTEPDVVWADEPTGALDTAAAGEMLDLLRGAVADDRTVVVVSHAPTVAERADRVVRMQDGRVSA